MHEQCDLAGRTASEIVAKLWLFSHALLVVVGLAWAALVWPEPVLPLWASFEEWWMRQALAHGTILAIIAGFFVLLAISWARD